MNKVLVSLVVVGLSLTSCDKQEEELLTIDEQIEQMQEADLSNKTTVIYNQANSSKNASSNKTTVEIEINNHSQAESEVVTEGDHSTTIYFGLLVEGEYSTTENSHEYIIGSVAYQFIDFPETTQNPDLVQATINYASGESIHVEPTTSFVINE